MPTVTIAGLDATEKQAVVIADNRLPEQAAWDFDVLGNHFKQLIDIDLRSNWPVSPPVKSTCCWTAKPMLGRGDSADDLHSSLVDSRRAHAEILDISPSDVAGTKCILSGGEACIRPASSPRSSSRRSSFGIPRTGHARYAGMRPSRLP